MRKLLLNKETLVALTSERLVLVQGAMLPESWTVDVCEIETRRTCKVLTEYPCNSVDTCEPQCPLTGCKGGLSKPA
jgi:hypothetical protein